VTIERREGIAHPSQVLYDIVMQLLSELSALMVRGCCCLDQQAFTRLATVLHPAREMQGRGQLCEVEEEQGGEPYRSRPHD
jgi:hypothetical protein